MHDVLFSLPPVEDFVDVFGYGFFLLDFDLYGVELGFEQIKLAVQCILLENAAADDGDQKYQGNDQ